MSDILSPDGTPTLTVPLTSFVGREPEIALLTALLVRPDVRLLTLTGTGGIGKTRLAFQIAADLAHEFPDGVIVVSLAPIRNPDLVLTTVAQILGVPDAPGQPLLTRLQAFLHDRHLLLVLDNLEHLLDATASLVAHLLAHCPRLTMFGTSRTRLGISGEQVVPLDALSPEAARQLFALRTQAVMPAFVSTDEMSPTIDAICARLDRLPLAIELAAARIPMLGPKALLARLDHQLDLLTGGPRDAPVRQRDMRLTIAWSHDLLTDQEQRLFRRLGAFVDGFTLEGAAEVAGEGNDVLAGISALLEAHLVRPTQGVGDEARFAMLETIREYALEKLVASGEEASVRHAHLHHLVELAEQLWAVTTACEADYLRQRLDPETGNIRAALAWALEHQPVEAARLAASLDSYWNFSSAFAEGRDWIERSLAAATTMPRDIRARALATAGWLLREQDNLEQAETYLREAAEFAQAVGDDRLLGSALNHIGKIEIARGNLEAAWRIYEDLRRQATAHGVPRELALATLNLGLVAMSMGNLAQAQSLLEDVLAMHQTSGSALGVAIAQMCLASAVLARGDNARAESLFQHAFQHFASLSDWANIARTLEGVAGAVVSRQPDIATRLLGAAAAMRERVGRPRDRADASAYGQAVEAARSLLGEEPFASAWEVGRSLSWDQVLGEMQRLAATDTDAPTTQRTEPDISHGLTRREQEVLRLLAEGHTNRAIAAALSISERTVENHVLHILTKLQLESRTSAATYAVRHGLA